MQQPVQAVSLTDISSFQTIAPLRESLVKRAAGADVVGASGSTTSPSIQNAVLAQLLSSGNLSFRGYCYLFYYSFFRKTFPLL